VSCAAAPALMARNPGLAADWEDFEDGFAMQMKPNVTALGIPNEIKIIAPEFPDIRVQHDIPSIIEIKSIKIPEVIQIKAPDKPIPSEIHIINETNIPDYIRLDSSDLPSAINVKSDLPTQINLVPINIPNRIMIDGSDIPDKIQVVGIPSVIEIKGEVPSEIFLKMPEDMEIPLVYRGGPIPVQFDLGKLGDPNEEGPPCFAITPCPKR
jgi:hypothetical protein